MSRRDSVFLIFILIGSGLLFGFEVATDREHLARALSLLTVRIIDGVNIKLVLGLVFAYVALHRFSAAIQPDGSGARDRESGARDREPYFEFTRHWGGLGAGEGGWEIDPAALRWVLQVVVAFALSAAAATLIIVGATTQQDATTQQSIPTSDAFTSRASSIGSKASSGPIVPAESAPPHTSASSQSSDRTDGGPHDASVADGAP